MQLPDQNSCTDASILWKCLKRLPLRRILKQTTVSLNEKCTELRQGDGRSAIPRKLPAGLQLLCSGISFCIWVRDFEAEVPSSFTKIYNIVDSGGLANYLCLLTLEYFGTFLLKLKHSPCRTRYFKANKQSCVFNGVRKDMPIHCRWFPDWPEPFLGYHCSGNIKPNVSIVNRIYLRTAIVCSTLEELRDGCYQNSDPSSFLLHNSICWESDWFPFPPRFRYWPPPRSVCYQDLERIRKFPGLPVRILILHFCWSALKYFQIFITWEEFMIQHEADGKTICFPEKEHSGIPKIGK